MNSLDSNLAFPHSLEPALALGSRSFRALPSTAAVLLLLLAKSRAQLLLELAKLALLHLLGTGDRRALAQHWPGGSHDGGRHLYTKLANPK